ncbi:MAG TPA: hypothetical protein VD837_05860 [Terriglobales bacterium]|nr:hypothetical protein [Terriglobales bacterium]
MDIVSIGGEAVLSSYAVDTGGLGQWVHQLEARTARDRGRRQQAGTHRLGRTLSAAGLLVRGRVRQGPKTAVEKTLRLESKHRFPLFHRRGYFDLISVC